MANPPFSAGRPRTCQRAAASVALLQLQDQFVHVAFKKGGCADADLRLRADDLLAVLPQ